MVKRLISFLTAAPLNLALISMSHGAVGRTFSLLMAFLATLGVCGLVDWAFELLGEAA